VVGFAGFFCNKIEIESEEKGNEKEEE